MAVHKKTIVIDNMRIEVTFSDTAKKFSYQVFYDKEQKQQQQAAPDPAPDPQPPAKTIKIGGSFFYE